MALSARIELAAGASANVDDFNPVNPGETVRVWAAGEAADGDLTCTIGSKGFGRGRTGIESVLNAGPRQNENLFAEWTQPGQAGSADLVIRNSGAVVVQIMVAKA